MFKVDVSTAVLPHHASSAAAHSLRCNTFLRNIAKYYPTRSNNKEDYLLRSSMLCSSSIVSCYNNKQDPRQP
jgi:hypothetical protein